MTVGAVALINRQALKHNLRRVREAAPGRKVMAIIKADGYGHGIERVAHALSTKSGGADAYGVARIDEAVALRDSGFSQPIVLLEGFLDEAELLTVTQHQLHVVVHHDYQIDILERSLMRDMVHVWLKIDTGMHRIGIDPANATRAWQRLNACAIVRPPVRLMTHLANADDRNDARTSEQLQLFRACTETLDAERSIANSGGILGWPTTHSDWVRPGIMLYGSSPFNGDTGADHGLKPVMTFKSRLIAVRPSRNGDAIGYGGDWVCPEDMPVGVIAAGYGDGYPRHARAGTPVRINGHNVPLIGRVSMDMICVDLRKHPNANIGDEAILWGAGLPAEIIAQHAGTISYHLYCSITQRVRFVDTDGDH